MMISTSILSIKDNIKDNVLKLNNTNTTYIHLDIMDGLFVSNKTWEYNEIKDIIDGSNKPLDVHLMVSDVIKYIDEYSNLNPEFITFHLEAADNVKEVIDYIHSKNIKVGLSIKPNTNIDLLIPYLNDVDMILLMSVEPGMGGQSFIDSSYERLNRLNELKNKYNFLIEIDGGINENNITNLNGVDIAVVGSYITSSENYQEQIDKLLNKVN